MNEKLRNNFLKQKLIYKKTLPWIENIILGLLVFLINDKINLNFDIRIVYIMAMGLIYGVTQSIFSAGFSIAIISYFIYQNNQFGYEMNIELFKMFILFFFIAIVSGFSKTNINMELKSLRNNYKGIEKLNHKMENDLWEAKNATIILAEQLKTSEQSYGRLYSIVKKLENLKCDELLDRIPEFVQELTGFDKSVLYIVNNVGEEIEIFRYKSLPYISMYSQEAFIDNKETIKEIINSGQVYINSKRKDGIPDAILPVKNFNSGSTYGIIAILDIPFNKMSAYTLQMLGFTGELISDYLTKSIMKDSYIKQEVIYE